MTAVLLLSNGHGEDLSGSLLARQLVARGVTVEALPLVGHGEPYRRAGIPVLGSTREFSTGGIGYTSLAGRFTEACEGQGLYLLGRLRLLACRRRDYRLAVVVGDVVPVLAVWLARMPAVVYLVAYSSHYEGRLRLPWPCGWLLSRPRCAQVWSRDALTAEDLSRQLGRPVRFLGNPFLDPVATGGAAPPPAAGLPCLALLPGSRMPEASRNLARMLRVLALLPPPLRRPGAIRCRAALVGDLTTETIARMAAPLGWRLQGADPAEPGQVPVLGCGELRLELHRERFAAVLGGADLVLASTGTAAEQAVGLGKPVIQLVGEGPQFTAGFADAQRRLLGPGVLCAAGTAGSPATLQATADLVAATLARLADAEAASRWRLRLAEEGVARLGRPGGSARMAEAIMDVLAQPASRRR